MPFQSYRETVYNDPTFLYPVRRIELGPAVVHEVGKVPADGLIRRRFVTPDLTHVDWLTTEITSAPLDYVTEYAHQVAYSVWIGSQPDLDASRMEYVTVGRWHQYTDWIWTPNLQETGEPPADVMERLRHAAKTIY